MVAYEMIFLIFILLSREIWRHSRSLQVFCQIESALKAERTRQYASISGRGATPPSGVRWGFETTYRLAAIAAAPSRAVRSFLMM